jgi:hypothetical protein
MAATVQDRNTPYRDGELTPVLVAKGEKIPAGVMVCLKAGYAVNGQTGDGLLYAGCSDEAADNSNGGDGDMHILVRRHKAFLWENDGTITQSHVGQPVYVLDNQTVTAGSPAPKGDAVAATEGVLAGTIIMLDADGVWVF